MTGHRAFFAALTITSLLEQSKGARAVIKDGAVTVDDPNAGIRPDVPERAPKPQTDEEKAAAQERFTNDLATKATLDGLYGPNGPLGAKPEAEPAELSEAAKEAIAKAEAKRARKAARMK